MIKRILVPTDGSDEAAVGVRYAVAAAQQWGATLYGVHVVDVKLLEGPFLRDVSASLGTAPYVNYQGNIAMILEEHGRAALDVLKRACEAAGVACEVSLSTGIVARTIVEKGQLTDLIIMGRGGEHSEWLDGLVGSTTEAVVRRTSQPVLVTGVDTPGQQRYLVAYDGSHHATRALQTAARMSSDWRVPLHVLVVGGVKAEPFVDEARGYLDAHELDVCYVRREGDPSSVIMEYARECDAGLLVMGAYGHTKVREMVVGSTTEYAINHSPCPLLLVR